jgi:hypothetical protein
MSVVSSLRRPVTEVEVSWSYVMVRCALGGVRHVIRLLFWSLLFVLGVALLGPAFALLGVFVHGAYRTGRALNETLVVHAAPDVSAADHRVELLRMLVGGSEAEPEPRPTPALSSGGL